MQRRAEAKKGTAIKREVQRLIHYGELLIGPEVPREDQTASLSGKRASAEPNSFKAKPHVTVKEVAARKQAARPIVYVPPRYPEKVTQLAFPQNLARAAEGRPLPKLPPISAMLAAPAEGSPNTQSCARTPGISNGNSIYPDRFPFLGPIYGAAAPLNLLTMQFNAYCMNFAGTPMSPFSQFNTRGCMPYGTAVNIANNYGFRP